MYSPFKMKMKGYGQGKNPIQMKSPMKAEESQAEKAKKVVAKGTGKELKNFNVQDVSAVQKDKKGNSFVVSLDENESYSGDSDNPVTTGWQGSKYVDRTAPRDTFMVSNNYPKGLLIDETQMETGDAQKQSTKVPSWQKYQLDDLKKEKAEKAKKKKKK